MKYVRQFFQWNKQTEYVDTSTQRLEWILASRINRKQARKILIVFYGVVNLCKCICFSCLRNKYATGF